MHCSDNLLGTCTAVVFLPTNIDTTQNVIVNMEEMNQAATWLVDKCAGERGIGGRFYHNLESITAFVKTPDLEFKLMSAPQSVRAQYQEAYGHQLPEIVIFGRDSLAQSILDRQFACSKDNRRDTRCKAQTRKPNLSSKLPESAVQQRPESSEAGQRKSCSGSCLDQRECNINANCICASNRGIPTFSFHHCDNW